jgi:hypothetical protein
MIDDQEAHDDGQLLFYLWSASRMTITPRPAVLFLDAIDLAKEQYLELSQVVDVVVSEARTDHRRS